MQIPHRVRTSLATFLAACAFFQGVQGVQSLARPTPVPPVEPPAEPINVLFILSDQHSTRALGCYQNGWGGVSESMTPELDTLSQQGVRFERAFCATAQCCPSRYSLMTGRMPHNHGLRWNSTWEPRSEVTFTELARAHGYVTGTFGKHHMFWLDQEPRTEDHGFDVVVDRDDYDAWCAANGSPPYDAASQVVAMGDLPPSVGKAGYTKNPNELHPAGFWADSVISFLEERAGPDGDGRPFVAWYSMFGPHSPVFPTGPASPEDWAHQFAPGSLSLPPNLDKQATTTRLATEQAKFAGIVEPQWRRLLSYYYGYVAQIDWNVGRVLAKLDELGLADNTVVVYTADHGEMGGEMRGWTKGAGSYDAITGVPLIVRLPGVLPGGKVSGELTSGVDLFPTLAELTGVYVPDALRERLDGRSLVELMTGPVPADWPRVVFNEFGAPNASTLRTRMARSKDAKYSYDELSGGEEELYHLSVDPWEENDLSESHTPEALALLADLKGRLAVWWNDEQGHAPIYLLTGDSQAKPARAQAVSPMPNEAGVPRDVDPTWLPATSADTQRAFLGTAPNALQLAAELVAMESRFNPGTLAPSTTYYWRVDSVNANGTSVGLTWSFTTESGGSDGPGLAHSPAPAHHATDVATAAVLEWTPPLDALDQSLWFGPEGQLHLLAASLPASAGTYSVGTLQAGVGYSWRVDAGAAGGTTEGTTWSFTTDATGLPGAALLPLPRHLDTQIAAKPVLRWKRGPEALSHDVWFGSSFPLAYAGNQTGQSFSPGTLVGGKTYYWRIDERNASGITRGLTWRFTVAK